MLERELEARFVKAVKAAGGKAYKFTSPGNDGVPDRLVILPGGKIAFVELKQKGKHPTRLQKKQIDCLKGLGCRVYVLDTVMSIDSIIKQIGGGN